jgi:hypothetical protein
MRFKIHPYSGNWSRNHMRKGCAWLICVSCVWSFAATTVRAFAADDGVQNRSGEDVDEKEHHRRLVHQNRQAEALSLARSSLRKALQEPNLAARAEIITRAASLLYENGLGEEALKFFLLSEKYSQSLSVLSRIEELGTAQKKDEVVRQAATDILTLLHTKRFTTTDDVTFLVHWCHKHGRAAEAIKLTSGASDLAKLPKAAIEQAIIGLMNKKDFAALPRFVEALRNNRSEDRRRIAMTLIEGIRCSRSKFTPSDFREIFLRCIPVLVDDEQRFAANTFILQCSIEDSIQIVTAATKAYPKDANLLQIRAGLRLLNKDERGAHADLSACRKLGKNLTFQQMKKDSFAYSGRLTEAEQAILNADR